MQQGSAHSLASTHTHAPAISPGADKDQVLDSGGKTNTGPGEHDRETATVPEGKPGAHDPVAGAAGATVAEPGTPHSLFLLNVMLLLGLLVGMQDDPIVDVVKLVGLDGSLPAVAGGRAAVAVYTGLGACQDAQRALPRLPCCGL